MRWAGKSHSHFPPCSLFDYSGPTFVVKNKVNDRCAKYLVQKVLNWNTKKYGVTCWRTGSKPCIPPFVVALHSGHLSQIDEHYSVHHFTESLRMRRDTIECFASMSTGTSRASYINLFWSWACRPNLWRVKLYRVGIRTRWVPFHSWTKDIGSSPCRRIERRTCSYRENNLKVDIVRKV